MFIIAILSISVICSADITPFSERTIQVRNTIIDAVGAATAANVTDSQLAVNTSPNLRTKGISNLKSGDLSGLTGQTRLNLFINQLRSLPDGIFGSWTRLTTLQFGKNSFDSFPISVTLQEAGTNHVTSVAPTGATFDYVITVRVTNGCVAEDTSTLTICKGNTQSNTFTVIRATEATDVVTVDLESFPYLPQTHCSYTLTKSEFLPTQVISTVFPEQETPNQSDTPDEPEPGTSINGGPENSAPVFNGATISVRAVTENSHGNTNIGRPVAAMGADGATIDTV